MQSNIFDKGLVIGVILLFIGIALAPSVTPINITKKETSDSDLIEITLQLCKTSGVEDFKMFITEEQDEQLDVLIESFKVDLDNADTREETIEVYNDMVVSLDKLGILPESTNCKEMQELVTGENSISNPDKLKSRKHFNQAYEKLKNKNSGLDENENRFCLIAGLTTYTICFGLVTILSLLPFLLLLLALIRENIHSDSDIFFNLFLLYLLFPLKLGGAMTFGMGEGIPLAPEYTPSEGWVHTNGLNGVKKWNGPFYGDVYHFHLGPSITYFGATGFTGIMFGPLYLGSALRVKLRPNPP